jgi:hypothetical protein
MKGLKIHRDIGIDIVIPYVAPMFQGHRDILLRIDRNLEGTKTVFPIKHVKDEFGIVV